jgi:hypothetical protein
MIDAIFKTAPFRVNFVLDNTFCYAYIFNTWVYLGGE